jgi:UDP-N-acetylmuramate-alanine ligase
MFLRVFLRTRKLCLCFGQSEARQLLFPRGLQVRGMSLQNVHLNYKEAIQMLDSMVSNFAARSRAVQYPKNKMDAHRELFRKAGLSLDQLDSLSIIHLAGTKGKGSTSAMCESILRQSGLRTGLYTYVLHIDDQFTRSILVLLTPCL